MISTKMPLAVVLSGVMFLAACDTANINSPDNPNRNTQTGVALGAASGAALGAIIGDGRRGSRQGAIIGAVVGAGAGGLIGQRLDRQEAELREQLGNNARIVNTGSQLIVTLPQDILFATGSAELSGGLRGDLQALAGSINRYPDTSINVIGHTDNVGGAAFNFDLSSRRAQSVASILIQSGVQPFRIRSIGRGFDEPVASNATAQGRQQNRRVDITITPNQ